MPSVRILSVDYGEKRIGLAISDPTGIFGQPLETIDASDPRSAAVYVSTLCRSRGVETIVLGLPRNMDGTLGPKAREALVFKDILEKETQVPVVTWEDRKSVV